MSSESERDQVIAEGWEIIAIMEEAVRRFHELPPRDPRPGASRPSPVGFACLMAAPTVGGSRRPECLAHG